MPDEITQLQSNFSKFVISIFGIMRTHLFSFSRWPGHLLISIFLKILRGKRASYLVTIYTHGFTFFPITSIMEPGHNPMFSGSGMYNRIDQFISGSFFGHGRRSSTNAQAEKKISNNFFHEKKERLKFPYTQSLLDNAPQCFAMLVALSKREAYIPARTTMASVRAQPIYTMPVETPTPGGIVAETFPDQCAHGCQGLPVFEVINSRRRKTHASSVWRSGN